jgi:acetyl esterase/lipase
VINLYGTTNHLTRREVNKQGTFGALMPVRESHLRVFGAADDGAPVLRLASPVTHVAQSSVPMLTLHGKIDALADYWQAEELDRVARERGARHELLLLDGVGHTFDLQTWDKQPMARDLRPVVLEFLEKNMH